MAIKRFEEILAWQKAQELTFIIYEQFRNCKDYGFCDQIRRAAVSVMNNIAEGFERRTNKEFRNFLYIAKGSCGEVRSMLQLAVKLGYVSKEEQVSGCALAEEISKMVYGLIRKLEDGKNIMS